MNRLIMLLVLAMSLLSCSESKALTIVGFGDSLTCTTCNDGSYLGLLGNYITPAPTIIDQGVSARRSSGTLTAVNAWINASNTADLAIVMTGTPDPYDAGYNEATTVGNVDSILGLIQGAGIGVILMAPPPVQEPCDNPGNCAVIDAALASLAGEYGNLATTRGIPFLDVYALFSSHPDFSEVPGSPLSLYRADGLHLNLTTGDDLIASEVAQLVPEPSSILLMSMGLIMIAVFGKEK